MKRAICMAVVAVMLATVGSASAGHGTTVRATYVGSFDFLPLFGMEQPCDPTTNFAQVCFDVDEDELSNLHFQVVDASGLPVTAYASVYTGNLVFGEQQFCGSHDIPVYGVHIDRIVVHIGGVQEGGCGVLKGLPDAGPVPVGSFSFGTTGEVAVTFS